jgi:hypothetical protein
LGAASTNFGEIPIAYPKQSRFHTAEEERSLLYLPQVSHEPDRVVVDVRQLFTVAEIEFFWEANE